MTPSEPEKVSKTVTGILDLNLLPDLTLIRYKMKSPCIRSVTTGPILSENRTNIEKSAAKREGREKLPLVMEGLPLDQALPEALYS